MIQLWPQFDNSFTCPECAAGSPIVLEIRFESVNIFADCICTSCHFEFLQTFPVGHTIESTFSIGKQSKKLYGPDEAGDWLAQSLLKSHLEMKSCEVAIEKIVYQKCDQVVILNALDYLYGHVLLKLYNAFYHLDQSGRTGLIVILPKQFEWLIPRGCAEAWLVNLTLSQLSFGYESIREFVSLELMRFRVVYLSKAYSHPNLSSENTARLTNVVPFNLKAFTELPRTVTFVLREDRWWLAHPIDYWFYRVCRKLKVLSWGSRFLSLRQNQLIRKVIAMVHKELPDAQFHVVGLGTTGRFDQYVSDNRQLKPDASVEAAWCKTYAKSHIVIGVHGSNMLLPTALAAGCIEVLPEDRYGNMVQDLSIRYSNRLQLFFYRFVDQFASAKSVSTKVVAMFRDYESYHRNMCRNTYPEQSMIDFAKGDDTHH